MTDWEHEHPIGTLTGDPVPGAPELAARGSCVTGVRTLMLTEPDQPNARAGLKDGAYPRYDRVLKAEVWYPALPGCDQDRAVYTDHLGRADLGNLEPFPSAGRAFRDAEPDPSAGPFPVAVISHGYPGSRFLLVNLAENLSSKGYVVISIGHTENTYEDFPASGSLESALIHRSRDQRFVISMLPQLNREGFLKGMLLPEKTGLIGFSMGGYGALRTIGGRLGGKTLENFRACAGELAEEEGFRGLKTVKAAALFAPATFFLDEDRSGDINIPTLWFCGTADYTVGYSRVRGFCERAVRSDRTLVSYLNCGHNVANNPAPPEAYSHPWEIFKRWSDPVWDTRRLNDANCHFLTAFLDLHLKGDASKADYLQGPVSGGTGAGSGIPGQPAEKPAEWKGFTEGTAAGIRLETFPAEK